MGFIKAFAGAFGGALADQWKDYLSVPSDLPDSVGLCLAVKRGANAGRGSNTSSSAAVITNGSLVVVPEGFALVTIENGSLTGFVTEAGGYRWSSDDPQSKSVFVGDGAGTAIFKATWDRFGYGGIPGTNQIAVFVNMKEIPGNKFGTQSKVYWDDAYLGAQAGATARGTYTLRITNPLLFIKEFVPAKYYSLGGPAFDFADFDNKAASQLFSEIVASLAAAFSGYANDSSRSNRMSRIQADSIGFAKALSAELEQGYSWTEKRGVSLTNASVIAIDYDESSRELLKKVQQADALTGTRGNANLQASLAEGIAAAGSNSSGGAIGLGMMGMGFQGGAAAASAVWQQSAPVAQAPAEDPYEKLTKLKGLLDNGVISQEDFDTAKSKLLGI